MTMKKLFTLIIGAVFVLNISAQTFSDNFDSYAVGDYIGVVGTDWTTWSGITGSEEDAQVTDTRASSSPHSIYFQSTTANGGPQDVVLEFGGNEFAVGQFLFESSFFVETDNGAYFNFQANKIIGKEWALDCFMVNDGQIYFTSGDELMFKGTYPVNTWFDLKMDIDLSTNTWNFYIDDVLQGSWSNIVNQIASIDIYPTNPKGMGGNEQCSFYIDNFAYTLTPYTLPTLNGAVVLVDPINALTGMEKDVNVRIRNLGETAITSYDLTVEYNGIQSTESITGVNIASLGYDDFTFPSPITLVTGANNLVVTISNVNGGTDEDANDDAKTVVIDPIVPAPGKVVFGEEATGTWCAWCVRGHVFMEYMAETYPDQWIGVAVHNNDPMTDIEYDAGIDPFISGWPMALVDRNSGGIDPSSFELALLDRISEAPAADISIENIAWDWETREITFDVQATFNADLTGDLRLNAVIVENGVTGTSSGYDQVNAYSGNSNGVMGGYENLPDPVPAADMVYDHVGRAILAGWDGTVNSVPSSVSDAEVVTQSYTYTIPEAYDETEIHIVGLLIDQADGAVLNAGEESIATLVEVEESKFNRSIAIYPSPSNGIVYVRNAENTNITIYNILGGVVAQGDVNGSLVSFNLTREPKGTYIVRITEGNKVQTQKIVISR